MSLPLPAFLVGALIAASLATPSASPAPESQVPEPQTPVEQEHVIVVETSSGASEIGLAKHLTKIHAKMYGAYWCPYCQAQLTMFGKEASQLLDLTECDANGKDAKPELCKKEKVMGYPTWIIKNRRYSGTQSLTALANASRYLGPRKFINPDQK
jgi:thiol-disulfide isomerase/thioredoxin